MGEFMALTDYAWLLREAYIKAYRRHQMSKTGTHSSYNSSPQWDGGTTASGRRCQPIWPKILRWLNQHGIADIEGYVAAQFMLPPGALPPFPTTFMSDKALARYRGLCATYQASIRESFGIQLAEASRCFQNAFSLYGERKRAMQAVVMAPQGAALTALMRFCLAMRSQLYDEAAVWYEAARQQYRVSPEIYNEVWGDFLPVGGVDMDPDQNLLPAVMTDTDTDTDETCYAGGSGGTDE